MITFQDYMKVPDSDKERADFVQSVINEHKASELYKTAVIATDYDKVKNTTITQYQKTITMVTGQIVPDRWSATHRSASAFFQIMCTQLTQYLLGNGVMWGGSKENDAIEQKLGKDFDLRMQTVAHDAMVGGVSYGYFANGSVTPFTALEYAAILDEDDGKMKLGVRFWQIDASKPLRATLYEVDGYTEYMWQKKGEPSEDWQKIDDGTYMRAKRPYTWVSIGDAKDRADGTEEIIVGAPANGLPIVPCYANKYHQSELVGLREKIDAWDLIFNGYEDDLDNAQIYWVIRGAGGMDDPDLQRFLDRLKVVKTVAPEDGQDVQAVPVNIPVEARERLLDRLDRQLYRDAMIMNPEDIASGATTATQIRAAYERQNVKCDQLEYGVLDFLYGIMELAGIEDEPSFTRSAIVNTTEEVQTVLHAAQFLDPDYVTRKILTIMGDGDKADDMIAKRDAMELAQIPEVAEETEEAEAEQ